MKHWATLVFSIFIISVWGQKPTATFYLIGDAGAKPPPGDALTMLKDSVEARRPNAVIFLGDNIYPDGLPTKGKKKAEAETKLNVQLAAVKVNATGRVIFIPGNHDWAASKGSGLKAIKAQAEYLKSNGAEFFPNAGFPGPAQIKLTEGLNAIFIDTQWFLHQQAFHPVEGKTRKQRKQMRTAFFLRLDSMLAANKANNTRTVLFYHHPMYTNGSHGTARQPLRFLVNYTPFHILGLVGATRLLRTDIPQPIFKRMRKKMLGVIDKYKGVVAISGHDHYQQLFNINGNYHVVTGAGSKLSEKHTTTYPEVFSNDTQQGFAKLEYFTGGKLRITFYGAKDRSVLYTTDLN